MSHLGESVSDLVDGRLDPSEAEWADTHLVRCPSCRQLVEAERLTKSRLQALPSPQPMDALAARLLAIPDDGETPLPARSGIATEAPVPTAAPPGSRRPGGGTRPVATGPGAPLRRPVHRSSRWRAAAAVAGSVGALSVGLFGLSVVSPSANAALAPTVDMLAVRNVITMSGLPMPNIIPAWRVAQSIAGQ